MEESLPSFTVVAENDATESSNPIHSDEVAQKLGFGGGLVPGVTVYGYLMQPLMARFGAEFLETGFVSARFRRPVYEGEKVVVESRITENTASRTRLSLAAVNANGEACAVAEASFPGPEGSETGEIPAEAPLPEARRPATPEELRRNPLLGTLRGAFDGGAAPPFVARLGEDHPVFREVAHPAWLLRQINYAVDLNLELGPWIHVSSDVQQLGVVRDGEDFQVRCRAASLYQRKGHEYADFDVAIVTDRPVMRVLHRAIYRMAES